MIVIGVLRCCRRLLISLNIKVKNILKKIRIRRPVIRAIRTFLVMIKILPVPVARLTVMGELLQIKMTT